MHDVTEVPLARFVETQSQCEAAKALGCTQGAVWQMLKNKRDIYIVMHNGVPVSGYEKKQFVAAQKLPTVVEEDQKLRKARLLARELLNLYP